MNTFLSTIIYTLARIGLLALFLGIGYFAGLRGYILLIVAFLVSAVASLFLLDSLRDRVSAGVFKTKEKIDKRIEDAAAKEDAWLDEQLRKHETNRENQSEQDK
ncbi:MAG: DUF4229 domain-containing protein [Actinobacteria bacterium]|nr:DUF4229 domain-containing protein [Actinomycetota bacterium]